MSNFRITGTRYTSKAGVANDSNAGTSPSLPKRTVAGGMSGLAGGSTLVIGTGVYSEAVNISITNITLIADGTVVYQGNSSSQFIISSSQAEMRGGIVRGYGSFERTATINNTSGSIFQNLLVLCLADFCKFLQGGGQFCRIQRCIFTEDALTSFTLIGISEYTFCIFRKNVTAFMTSPSSLFRNNDVQGNAVWLGYAASFGNNNIRGTVRFLTNGQEYAVRDGRTGTPQDHGYAPGVVWATGSAIRTELGADTRGTTAAWDAAIATCISRDPQFNDPAKLDFTLKAASPNIGRASDSTNIGGTQYSRSYFVTALDNIRSQSFGADQNVAITSDANLQLLSGTDIDIASGTDGAIETGWIEYAVSPREIGIVRYIGKLAFNRDNIPGSDENENVPDNFVFDPGQPGDNPERLVFEMQWHNGTTPPGPAANADNGGIAPAGTWQVFEWNAKPEIDGAGVTSGNPAFNTGTRVGINVRWYRLRIRLRNNFEG